MKRFENRTVIVTGGARGLGASHARGFVAEGANVVIADVLEQEGQTLADELGDQAIFSRLDVTNEKDWAATVAAAEDAFGPVSVLVNNAGIVRFGPIAKTEPTAWRQVIDINLTGTYLGIRAVAPSMRKAGGGAIVNTSAAAGMIGQFGLASYVSSKWGLRGLTKTAALELARDNIRVNIINPVAGETAMLADFMGEDTPERRAQFIATIPLGRLSLPSDVATAAVFFASDEAAFITGACL